MSIRFTDILTTANALATYLGDPVVVPNHLIEAVAILREEKGLEDFGPGMSPMIPRSPGGAVVRPDVRDLTQRWFKAHGSDPLVRLEDGAVDEFVEDLLTLEP